MFVGLYSIATVPIKESQAFMNKRQLKYQVRKVERVCFVDLKVNF